MFSVSFIFPGAECIALKFRVLKLLGVTTHLLKEILKTREENQCHTFVKSSVLWCLCLLVILLQEIYATGH